MKSTVCYLDGSGREMDHVLREVEKTAVYTELGKHETVQLRLLAEEMTGIIRGLTNKFEAEFWVEEHKGTFYLNLASELCLDREKKEKLISVSSSKKNSVKKGIMGKIGQLFEAFIESRGEIEAACKKSGMMSPGLKAMRGQSNLPPGGEKCWSFTEYKKHLDKKEDVWDELECSIVAKLADDVVVSIWDEKVHLTIIKTF